MNLQNDARYNNVLGQDDSVDMNLPLPIHCKEHGFFICSSAENHLEGEGCPVCDKTDHVDVSDGDWIVALVERKNGHFRVEVKDTIDWAIAPIDLSSAEYVKYAFADTQEHVQKVITRLESLSNYDIKDVVKVFTDRIYFGEV